jgi:hypothetical protein
MPDADTRRRLLPFCLRTCGHGLQKQKTEAKPKMGKDKIVEDYLQLYNVRSLCFASRHHHHRHHHRLTRLVTKLQEKHRPESLVSQHAKSVNEKKLEKVPFSSFIYMMMMMDHQHTLLFFWSLVSATTQAKAKEDEEWKPWDRDEMGSRQLPAEARASVLRKAKDFHSRFSAQSGNRFL